MTTGWNADTYHLRIADAQKGRRWAGGSPNATEIAAYLAAIPRGHPRHRAVVLGMTPELRLAALQHFDHVVSVDRNADAHAVYGGWVPAELRRREKQVCGDWRDIETDDVAADVVFGDGVFGNCCDEDEALAVLTSLRRIVGPHGLLITRHACYPDDFAGMVTDRRALIAAFHEGSIDDEELGFALRLSASVGRHWDPRTCLLDCAGVYTELDQLARDGVISDEVLGYGRRYHYSGRNWIPDETRWTAVLARSGWHHERHALMGKDWYRYYPLYRCWPVV